MILLHGVISLPDATSYDNYTYFMSIIGIYFHSVWSIVLLRSEKTTTIIFTDTEYSFAKISGYSHILQNIFKSKNNIHISIVRIPNGKKKYGLFHFISNNFHFLEVCVSYAPMPTYRCYVPNDINQYFF